jgi:hypothetical protein
LVAEGEMLLSQPQLLVDGVVNRGPRHQVLVAGAQILARRGEALAVGVETQDPG